MIEIVFSDSACGSLKMAQRYGMGEYRSGAIGVLVSHTNGSKPTKKEIESARRKAEEKARSEWENAAPLGGNPADVYAFGLSLSIGDISESTPGARRRQVLERLYNFYPGDEGPMAAQELLQGAENNLKTVCGRAAAGEALRIWYSNQPDELCGIYWFMAQLDRLEGRSGQVSLVKLPEWEAIKNDTILQRTSWGEVPPGEWHRYLSLQRPAPPEFCPLCAFRWRKLQEENAPLRAMLNTQLVSMPESLYDSFIVREIAAADESFQEAAVIGRIIGKYQLGIGDCWIALRIEEMIGAGKLEIVREALDNMPAYHRLLKKCTD